MDAAFWTEVFNFWYLTALLLVGIAPLVAAIAVCIIVSDWLKRR